MVLGPEGPWALSWLDGGSEVDLLEHKAWGSGRHLMGDYAPEISYNLSYLYNCRTKRERRKYDQTFRSLLDLYSFNRILPNYRWWSDNTEGFMWYTVPRVFSMPRTEYIFEHEYQIRCEVAKSWVCSGISYDEFLVTSYLASCTLVWCAHSAWALWALNMYNSSDQMWVPCLCIGRVSMVGA